MRYPCLVRKRDCKTAVKVCLEPEGLGVYGEPLPALELDLVCNYQDSAKSVLTADKKLVQLSGVALFPGDIAPSFETLSGGMIEIAGTVRRIFQGQKHRNPDGTVNYSELDVV